MLTIVILYICQMIDQVEDLVRIADENMKRLEDMALNYDESKYIDDVEMTASLAVSTSSTFTFNCFPYTTVPFKMKWGW